MQIKTRPLHQCNPNANPCHGLSAPRWQACKEDKKPQSVAPPDTRSNLEMQNPASVLFAPPRTELSLKSKKYSQNYECSRGTEPQAAPTRLQTPGRLAGSHQTKGCKGNTAQMHCSCSQAQEKKEPGESRKVQAASHASTPCLPNPRDGKGLSGAGVGDKAVNH